MRDQADVVVIGAGIMGLSIAYNLATECAVRRVTVVDRSYLCGGASGRNGGGVRAQWSSEANILLMQESLRLFAGFARKHRINTWFRRGGYLFLTRTDAAAETLEKSAALQRQCGLTTRSLTPSQARQVVPQLDVDRVVAATFNADDAVVFPWPFVWGYAEGARAAGVEVCPFTNVTDIETTGGSVSAVVTERGRIETDVAVIAGGAHSPEIAELAGVDLPNRPHRHEICSSEPLKPWLGPLVADLTDGLYFSQSTRGEIVGGIGNSRVPLGPNQESSDRFLALYANAVVRTCPVLAKVKVLRQWAGLYDLTPDNNPIVGKVDEVGGLFLACGFVGHGFMMAPVIGRLLAAHVARGLKLPMFDRWNLRRFAGGELLDEGMIIG